MNRIDRLAILIVDDQPEVLEVYNDVLSEDLGHSVETVSTPGVALRLVRTHLFDIVIVDAKISYKGASLGGLLLAEEIGRVLGSSSVIVMSQYDVKNEVSFYNSAFPFLAKPASVSSLLDWVQRELMSKIRSSLKQQVGFVVMPFNHGDSDEWYRAALQPWMKEAGFNVKRMDEIQHTRAIDSELLQRIEAAHFVVLYASGVNANVYFEAGFATALGKYMVVFAETKNALPFDIRSVNYLPVTAASESGACDRVVRFMTGLRGLG